MEPGFHQGDLVMIRKAPYYHLGDIVAYEHPGVGHIFHRIVDRNIRGFVLQGDNNPFLDNYYPAQGEVIGKLWVHIPKAGNVLNTLRQPGYFTAIVIGFVFLAVVPSDKSDQPKNPNDPEEKKKKQKKPRKVMESSPQKSQEYLFLFAVLFFVALLLGFISFSTPPVRVAESELLVTHQGSFSYSAEAPPGVYDNPEVQTGEPLFRRLSDSLHLDFSYAVQTDALDEVHGAYWMTLEIHDNSGWMRTMVLLPEAKFEGQTLEMSAEVDLTAVQKLIDFFESRAGVSRNSYTIVINPVVVVKGMNEGNQVEEHFTPHLYFQMDPFEMLMITPEGETDPIHPSEVSVLSLPVVEPNTIIIFNFELPVSTARTASVIGLILTGLAAGWFGWKEYQLTKAGEVAQILNKHAELIVNTGSKPANKDMVAVEGFDDLLKLAQRHFLMILHSTQRKNHYFFVKVTDDQTYYYQVEE
jgi:signal peptidase I